jgi:HTH-type transcriptional regulator/antitoxin HigA
MKPKVIKTDKEYEAALAAVDSLMDAAPGSAKEAELELWSVLVEDYERKEFPIDLPDPVEAIRFRMEQQGLRPAALGAMLGSKSRASEVLNRKRPLSLAMIRSLSSELRIPAEVLIKEPRALPAKKPRKSLSPVA